MDIYINGISSSFASGLLLASVDSTLLQGHSLSIALSLSGSQSFGSLFIGSPISFYTYETIFSSPPPGTPIGQLVSTVQGSFSLVAGDGSEDNSYFYIVEDELITSSIIDKNSYQIRVLVSGEDGYCYEQKLLIIVVDVLELPGFSNNSQLGEALVYLSVLPQGLASQEILNDHTLTSSLILSSIATEELLGTLSFDGFLGLIGFGEGAVGGLTSSMSYSLGSVETEEGLEDSILTDFFSEFQTITWNVDQLISINTSITWDIGQGVERWYRVQGCCIFPTAQGSGNGISGPFYPGGCDITNFESTDSKCIGAGGKQLFIQNILATSVSDVCRQLNEYNMKWQVCSMQVYSNPAGPALDECNRLIDVPFSSYPECLEISLHTDALVKVSFFSYATICFKYQGSGGIEADGQVTPTGATSLSSYSYLGHGVLYTGGSGEISSSWKELLEVDVNFDFYVDYAEASLSIRSDRFGLSGVSGPISTVCGNCTSIPSILYSYNDIDRSYVLSRFISKNGIEFPSYFPMYYNSLLKSWVANYQVSGYGDLGEENWNFVFTWSCLNQRADEYSSPYWKYSIFVNRSGQSLDHDTRISITFPPQELCRLIDNLSVDFSFSLNVSTLYIDNAFVDVTDYVVLSDRIGLFKDASWSSDPWLDMRISRLASSSKFQTIDLSPIIP